LLYHEQGLYVSLNDKIMQTIRFKWKGLMTANQSGFDLDFFLSNQSNRLFKKMPWFLSRFRAYQCHMEEV